MTTSLILISLLLFLLLTSYMEASRRVDCIDKLFGVAELAALHGDRPVQLLPGHY